MKPVNKISVLIFFLILSAQVLWASTTLLSGKVVNAKQEGIAFATLYLIDNKNNITLKSTISNELGEYNFTEVELGTYLIEVRAIGYETTRIPAIEVTANIQQVPQIELPSKTTTLAEVSIEAKKPLIERKADMLVVNVENSPLAAGNNALDILSRSPGVNIDNNGNITLLGQAGVNIMIDGKQTFMSEDQLNALLKSTDGNAIKSVEIISSPSAKYDAAGTAGIINIVLKKNKLVGTNGSVNASIGAGYKFRGNSSLSLNHKTEKANYFANYSYDNSQYKIKLDLDRIIMGNQEQTAFNQQSNLNNQNKAHNFRVGIEQQTSLRNSIGLILSGVFNDRTSKTYSATNIGPNLQQVDSLLRSNSQQNTGLNSLSVNLSNQFKINEQGRSLTADIDISRFKNTNQTQYKNELFLPDFSPLHTPELQSSDMPSDFEIYVAKVDYTHPLTQKSKIESGLKYSYVNTDNDLTFQDYLADQWITNAQRTNHFIYTENVAAAYGNYTNQLGKWGLQLGLRVEYTRSTGNSITLDNIVARDYLDWFPNAALSYAASEHNQFSLAYNKRISRPNYNRLNPFESFIDKYTYEKGNPYLEPQYSHGIDFNYTAFKTYSISLGYKKTLNEITETLGQNEADKTSWITRENLATGQVAYINISAPIQVSKSWSIYNNINAFYLHFSGLTQGEEIDLGQAALQGLITNTFKINAGLSAELSARYTSKMQYSLYKIEDKYALDLGLTKNFKDKRSSLKLAIQDILRTNDTNLRTDFGKFNTSIRQNQDTRVLRLSYSYKFGNLGINTKRKSTDNEEKARTQ